MNKKCAGMDGQFSSSGSYGYKHGSKWKQCTDSTENKRRVMYDLSLPPPLHLNDSRYSAPGRRSYLNIILSIRSRVLLE